MTTNSLNDYSTTVASNSNIAGTSIAVGCAPADVGIFMRTIMAQLAYAVQGPPNLFPATWYAGELDTNTSNGGTGNANVANNLVVDGSITLANPTNGYSPSVWQNIASYTLAGATSQAIALPTGYRRFRLTLQGVTASTFNATISLQFSSNAGVSYITTGYSWLALASDTSGGAPFAGSVNGDIAIVISPAFLGSAVSPLDATYEIYPGSASLRPVVRGTSFSLDNSSQFIQQLQTGTWVGSPVLMNFMKIFINSGTMSGTLIIEALV